MNQPLKNQGINLLPGTVVQGKWHQKKYRILKRLGHGACGTVFLAEEGSQRVALKVSENGSAITTEVNVLKTFKQVQGSTLGPYLLDVDDWVQPKGKILSFYAMEYLKGNELSVFLKNHGREWLGVLITQLLDDLTELHQSGWVFGDLKPENLIVTYPPPKLRWIDVGGTTQTGRAIKEYTEFYDRGYWGMGSRKADPAYDLFALAMVMIQTYHPSRFERGANPEKVLMTKLYQTAPLKPFLNCIKKALYGQYASSNEMRRDITNILMEKPKTTKYATTRTVTRVNKAKIPTQNNHPSSSKKNGRFILEGLGILVVVFLFYVVYLFMQWV